MEETRKDLQRHVGDSPQISIESFKNWSGSQTRSDIFACRPTSVEEVQNVIKAARKCNLQVRAAARTHSWTPLFSDEGQLVVHTKDIERPDGPQIELHQGDGNERQVTVAASVPVSDFMEFQLTHAVCLPANTIIRVLQMGGVIIPGCHGVGWETKTMCDYVETIRIVNSNGDLQTYSINKDQDMMRAVQCSLGLWGIVIDFTLKVDPMYIVEVENSWMSVRDVFYDTEKLCQIITGNDSVEIFWFPFSGISTWESIEAFLQKDIDLGEWDPKDDKVWVRIINKAENAGEVMGPTHYAKHDFHQWVQSKGFQLADDLVRKFPQSAPSFNKMQVDVLDDVFKGGEKIYQQLPHAVHFLNYVDEVPVYDLEWAFSLDKDCSNIATAAQKVIEMVQQEATEGRFPMNLPLEMRFIGDSNAFMSPAMCANTAHGGTGHTAFIEVLAICGTPHFQDFVMKVSDVWKTLTRARPHWCKGWEMLPHPERVMRQAYKDQIPQFLSALERSQADPDGMFFNKCLERLFYPKGHQGRRKTNQNQKKKIEPEKRQPNKSSKLCEIL